jgi:hypothetical protein
LKQEQAIVSGSLTKPNPNPQQQQQWQPSSTSPDSKQEGATVVPSST